MRKLKLQVQMTVDGFMAGPNGEMDFMVWNWDDALKQYVQSLTDPVDTIVLGRKLAEGFIPYWASVAADADNPEVEAGKKFTDTHKVVFTKTLGKDDPKVTSWNNTVLAKGALADEINKLKKQSGKDIIVYGGSTFVSALIDSGLIDEFHLFINPSSAGKGLPVFGQTGKQNLTLASAQAFDCGIVVLKYVLARKS